MSKDFTVTINIAKCPYFLFKEFKEFAGQYTGDLYWPALQLLLERSKRLELYEGEEIAEEQIVQETKSPEYVGISRLEEKRI